MKLEFQQNGLGTGPNGLEISIQGFRSSPADEPLGAVQVFIEVYEGKLRVHVWDGSSFDPVSVVIEPRGGE